jgi:hypothetical protein
VRHQEKRLADLETVEQLGEIPQKLLQRIGGTRRFGLTVTAQVERNNTVVAGKAGYLRQPLFGAPAGAVNEHHRTAHRRGRCNINDA